jgi:hypothetical protein
LISDVSTATRNGGTKCPAVRRRVVENGLVVVVVVVVVLAGITKAVAA